jgi:hypothetical protein
MANRQTIKVARPEPSQTSATIEVITEKVAASLK